MSRKAEVVAAAQEMHRLGLVVGTAGNVSARADDAVHITPAGRDYAEMTERDLVTLALDGTPLEFEHRPSSEYRVHLAIYRARPDAGAIVHTHSVHATAWSCLNEPLDTGVKEFAQALGGPVVTAPDAPPGSDELAQAAVEAVGDRHGALLYRHGVLALGDSPTRALVVAQVIERHAQMAFLLR